MKIARYEDKSLVVGILSEAFKFNKSVNFLVKQDKQKERRIKFLIEYAFDICKIYGEAYLSNDNNAAALILYPHKKKTSVKSTLMDVKLAIKSIGIERIFKVLKRQNGIQSLKPDCHILHLWFLGVKPEEQQKRIGSALLKEIMEKNFLPIYLETSMEENLPFYRKLGFEVYDQLNLGYKLYLIRRHN